MTGRQSLRRSTRRGRWTRHGRQIISELATFDDWRRGIEHRSAGEPRSGRTRATLRHQWIAVPLPGRRQSRGGSDRAVLGQTSSMPCNRLVSLTGTTKQSVRNPKLRSVCRTEGAVWRPEGSYGGRCARQWRAYLPFPTAGIFTAQNLPALCGCKTRPVGSDLTDTGHALMGHLGDLCS